MTPGVDWGRVKALFALALEQPEATRDAWIDTASGDAALAAEVRSLLAARSAPDRIAHGVAQLLSPLTDESDATAPKIGSSVGAYRLLRELGVGGMGRVYLAERADGQFSHQVALKLIRSELAAPELIQRFLRERDTLARLAHPNIAQLHDGGVSAEGAPYFTLEYIDGEPIGAWCDAHRLEVRERVRLFLKVCDAVEHAHRNLIVHRDIKPSNILVTDDGEPKLLDFGIAKPLQDGDGGVTGTQARPMTREYAAPEQILGDPVTTATDVYSLGVLAYLLLCGRMPYRRAALGETSWTKAILEEPPEPLERAITRTAAVQKPDDHEILAPRVAATMDVAALAAARATTVHGLRRALHGDVERIIQRALAKSPDTRYPTVGEFSRDLRAYLDGRAISGGTRTYRLRKFVRRYWLPIGAGAFAMLALMIGAAGVAWEARQREHEAERALREERTTKAVKDFLFGLFTAVDPHEAKGKDISARELLDRGAKRIETNSPAEPVLKAELQGVLGRIYYQLGLYAPAGDLQQRALDTLTPMSDQSLLVARTEIDRADTLRDSGEAKAAAALVTDALERLEKLPTALPEDKVRALYVHGATAVAKRDFAQVKRDADSALAIANTTPISDELMAYTLLQAGNAEWGLQSLDAAQARYTELMNLALRMQGPEGLMVSTAHINLGIVFASRSQYAQAVDETEKALAIDLKVRGPQHSKVFDERGAIGQYYYHQGRYRQATELLQQVLDWQRTNRGADNPDVAGTDINLGTALSEVPDLDAAERAFLDAQRIWQAKFGPDFIGVQIAGANLGYVYRVQGNLDRAEEKFLAFKQFADKNGQGDDPELHYQLGEVQRLRGNAKDAVDLDSKAVKFAKDSSGENSETAAMAHYYLGLALRDNGDAAGAERELRASLASFEGYIPKAEHPRAATTRMALADLIAHNPSRRTEASALATEALSIRRSFLGADDPHTLDAQKFVDNIRR